MTARDYVAIADGYIDDVLSGEIPACKWVRLACERQRRDLERLDWQWRFDPERAAHVCRFVELLPHVKGEWARGRGTIVLSPWQCFVLSTVFGWVNESGHRRFKKAYTEIPRKNAKALWVGTPVPTPAGWTTMGALQPGDQVIGADGLPCTVQAVSDVFTDHECYRLTFSNGEQVVADAGHQWVTSARVDSPGRRTRVGIRHGASVVSRVRTTEEIAATVRYGARGDVNHGLQMPGALDLPAQDLLVGPYTLGAWLGDGHSRGARLTCGREDAEIIDGIRGEGYPVRDTGIHRGKASTYSLSDGRCGSKAGKLQSKLRLMGVLNNKHIPDVYLRASLSQRIALLQGLMDTDGTVSKNGRVLSYTTISERLAVGVAELLASLGIKYSLSRWSMRCSGRAVEGVAHRLQFMVFRDEIPAFRLRRKLERMRSSNDCTTAARSRTVQVVACERTDSIPVRCISVDSPDHQFRFGRTMLPTHNSTLSSGVGLYLLTADGEPGAEVYSAATTRDQAKIVWGDARAMTVASPMFRRRFGVETGAHSIFVAQENAAFKPLSRDQGGNLDGLNLHGGIVDEFHGHKDRAIWDVLVTAMGARSQPLLWAITTAGFDRSGICYEERSYISKVLDRVIDDDEYFGIIYTIDDADDWTDPASWQKANPNWGVSVKPEAIEREARKAMQMASAQNNFLTKHLNVWVNADTAWMDMRAWERCADPSLTLEAFAGARCVLGLDLASKIDIAAKLRVIEREGIYYLFGEYYLPERAVEMSGNSQYDGWRRDGWLTITDGEVTDYDVIEDGVRADCVAFDVAEVAYDPFQATQLSGHLLADGVPMVEMRPTVLNFSEPMKWFEALVISGKLRHNGDPVLTWMVSNVVCHRDAKDNIYPRKDRPEMKIDGVVAAIMALGRMMNQTGGRSFWEADAEASA